MDPEATSPDGAHALVALLRDHGVEVVEADDVADVERSLTPDTLLLVAQTDYLIDEDVLQRLADAARRPPAGGTGFAHPGGAGTRGPRGRRGQLTAASRNATCAKPNAQARSSWASAPPTRPTGDIPLTRCYDDALVRYSADGRTVTVVGSADFMTNSGLLKQGNAALAMNLAGTRSRVVWYAPQRIAG